MIILRTYYIGIVLKMSKTIFIGKKFGFKRYVKKENDNETNEKEHDLEVQEEKVQENDKTNKTNDDLTKIAKRKLIEDAKRVNEISDKIGISAAVKKPKLENRLFLANVVRQAHFSNESKRVKTLNKKK